MSYMHIQNLYADQRILQYRLIAALEKIHGTSAHITKGDGDVVTFSGGGETQHRFLTCFDVPAVSAALKAIMEVRGYTHVTIYGEAYGGSQQRMAHVYGPKLRFVAFDVSVTTTEEGSVRACPLHGLPRVIQNGPITPGTSANDATTTARNSIVGFETQNERVESAIERSTSPRAPQERHTTLLQAEDGTFGTDSESPRTSTRPSSNPNRECVPSAGTLSPGGGNPGRSTPSVLITATERDESEVSSAIGATPPSTQQSTTMDGSKQPVCTCKRVKHWLDLVDAQEFVWSVGLDFVPYKVISNDLAAIDAQRDAPSEQARKNGVEGDQPREGVVLKCLKETVDADGERVMAKHKQDRMGETATPRKVVNPAQQVVLDDAVAIAKEWVVLNRLEHVMGALLRARHEAGNEAPLGIQDTGTVCAAMVEDVIREAGREIVVSKEAKTAISKRASLLFREHLKVTALGT